MDGKNILMAIVLSTVVLVVWATFFEPTPIENKITENEVVKNEENISPKIEEIESSKKIARSEAIKSVKRIKLENNNIKGSISLQGAIIDDITFKNYYVSLESNENVVLLNPKKSEKGYYIETGWASSGNDKLALPLDDTVWKIKGNNILKPNNPVILEWNNNDG